MKAKFAMGLALAVLATQAFGARPATAEKSPASAPGFGNPRTLPSDSVYQLPLVLTDQHGRARDWRDRRGKPQLVAMFYSNCPYMCPLIIEAGKAVDLRLSNEQRKRLDVLYISMDPSRDTPARLAQVVRERHVDDARWTLASPQPNDVRGAAGILDIRYRQLSNGEFNHTSALILLDADGRILARTEKVGSDIDPAFLGKVREAL